MNVIKTDRIRRRLQEIRDDVEAIDHHQIDRLVEELDEVIGVMGDPAKQDVRKPKSNLKFTSFGD